MGIPFPVTGVFSHFPQLEGSNHVSRTEVRNNRNVLIYLDQVRALLALQDLPRWTLLGRLAQNGYRGTGILNVTIGEAHGQSHTLHIKMCLIIGIL